MREGGISSQTNQLLPEVEEEILQATMSDFVLRQGLQGDGDLLWSQGFHL